MNAVLFVAIVLVGYLLGSIPFGLIISRSRTGTDLRQVGSGKTGMTNVLRTAGKKAAALVLILDMAKGALPVVLAGLIFRGDAGRYRPPLDEKRPGNGGPGGHRRTQLVGIPQVPGGAGSSHLPRRAGGHVLASGTGHRRHDTHYRFQDANTCHLAPLSGRYLPSSCWPY